MGLLTMISDVDKNNFPSEVEPISVNRLCQYAERSNRADTILYQEGTCWGKTKVCHQTFYGTKCYHTNIALR